MTSGKAKKQATRVIRAFTVWVTAQRLKGNLTASQTKILMGYAGQASKTDPHKAHLLLQSFTCMGIDYLGIDRTQEGLTGPIY